MSTIYTPDGKPISKFNRFPVDATMPETFFDNLVVADRFDDILLQFQYDVDSLKITKGLTGSATVNSVVGKRIELDAPANGDVAFIESRDALRNRPGREGYITMTAKFDPNHMESKQITGLFDENEGFFTGFIDGVFSCGYRIDGVDTIVQQPDFNLDLLDGIRDSTHESAFEPNFTIQNFYRIRFGLSGMSPVTFEIMNDDDGEWVEFHRIVPMDVADSVLNYVLPGRLEVENYTTGATPQAVQVSATSWNAGVVGNVPREITSKFFADNSDWISVKKDNLYNLITIRNNSTFQGKKNRLKISPNFIGILTKRAEPYNLIIVKNAEFATPLAYSDFRVDKSLAEISKTDADIVPGSGIDELRVPIQGQEFRMDLADKFLTLLPGETLSFVGQKLGTNYPEMVVNVRWEEIF